MSYSVSRVWNDLICNSFRGRAGRNARAAAACNLLGHSVAAMTDSPSHLLFTARGQRKYITQAEGERFIEAAGDRPLPVLAFVWLLLCSGCRISEALELTAQQLDVANQAVIFRTLKRRTLHYRAVPVPEVMMELLEDLADGLRPQDRLWHFSRQTAWREVKAIMADAEIIGPQACPRGLRHGYGVACALKRVPIGITQNLMGHSTSETTAIYQQILGNEANNMLSGLWQFRLATVH